MADLRDETEDRLMNLLQAVAIVRDREGEIRPSSFSSTEDLFIGF